LFIALVTYGFRQRVVRETMRVYTDVRDHIVDAFVTWVVLPGFIGNALSIFPPLLCYQFTHSLNWSLSLFSLLFFSIRCACYAFHHKKKLNYKKPRALRIEHAAYGTVAPNRLPFQWLRRLVVALLCVVLITSLSLANYQIGKLQTFGWELADDAFSLFGYSFDWFMWGFTSTWSYWASLLFGRHFRRHLSFPAFLICAYFHLYESPFVLFGMFCSDNFCIHFVEFMITYRMLFLQAATITSVAVNFYLQAKLQVYQYAHYSYRPSGGWSSDHERPIHHENKRGVNVFPSECFMKPLPARGKVAREFWRKCHPDVLRRKLHKRCVDWAETWIGQRYPDTPAPSECYI
jgi:hypothetical protein